MKVSLSPDLACDVWTSHLRDRSLVLGGNNFLIYTNPSLKTHEIPGVRKRALLMQDVESLTNAWRLETQSDVFALHQEEVGPSIIMNNSSRPTCGANQCLVYTGSRSGSIRRFDTRSRGPGLSLLGEAFTKSFNSITYLNIIKDWQLLVTTIRGAVRLFLVPLGACRLRNHIPVRQDRDVRCSLLARSATTPGTRGTCEFIPA